MAKDNEQYARQQELARAFDEKRKARHEAINKRLQAILGKDREMSAPFQGALTGAFALAFAKNKYPSPSVFVRKDEVSKDMAKKLIHCEAQLCTDIRKYL